MDTDPSDEIYQKNEIEIKQRIDNAFRNKLNTDI